MKIREENLIEKALKVALNFHYGATDRANQPYILHCLRVMNSVPNEQDIVITAILHDIIEDTPISIKTLKKMGFSDDVLCAIDAISKRDEEEYMQYIARVCENSIAYQVKIADLKDNINVLRLEKVSSNDIKLVKKYHEAYKYLMENRPC